MLQDDGCERRVVRSTALALLMASVAVGVLGCASAQHPMVDTVPPPMEPVSLNVNADEPPGPWRAPVEAGANRAVETFDEIWRRATAIASGFALPAGPDIDLPDARGFEDAPTAANPVTGLGPVIAPAPAAVEEAALRDAIPGALSERVRQERREAFNPYVLTAHKHNFVLPVSYSSAVNETVYQQDGVPLRDGLVPTEIKFQISLKTQLNESDLWLDDDSLSFGLTLEAWWQLYSTDLSSPFRESNYTPEVFYMVPLLWGPFGGSTTVIVGLEHQSNGQVQQLSRSWNRLYSTLLYERGSFVAALRPWYRLPEKRRTDPDDPEGDDNPDILDFMGHGELSLAFRNVRNEYALRVRGNPRTGKGAVTLGATFPLFGRFRGFLQYFDGYGDSLIDYNHAQRRIGLGVALTNLF